MEISATKMSRVLLFLTICTGCLSQEDRIHFPEEVFDKLRPSRASPQPSEDDSNYEPFLFDDNSGESSSPMKTLFSWKQLDFTFPNSSMREEMIKNEQFIPINNLVLDTDVYVEGSKRKYFVTIPRARPGVPVSLATVSTQRKNGEYLLKPFPNWETHTALFQGNCDAGITSVMRTHVDECGRLWVLDSGSLNAFNGNGAIVCPPKLLIYDLKNKNRLVGKFPIPESMIASNSLFVTIVVDIRNGKCNDAFAYIADSIAYKMIVFDLRNKEFWRINSIQFFPYPDKSRFNINGETFDLFGGVFGLTLGPVYQGNKRILYFHSIDSVRQSWADTADLRNHSLWKDNMNAKPRAFNLFSGSRPSQSTTAAMNEHGIMFFPLVGSNEMACWNTQMKFNDKNIVRLAKDDASMQFVSGIKVAAGKVYAASGRQQKYMNHLINKDEKNYRVLVGDIQKMTRHTKCEVQLANDRFGADYSPDAENVDVPAELLLSESISTEAPPLNISAIHP